MECSLLRYLKSCSDVVRSGTFAGALHVVLGNEACDLDSVVSALSYAFYKHQMNTESSSCTIPMLNIPRSDFPLRTESRFVLGRHGITASHLTFRDDLDLGKVKERLELTLVDHNVLGAGEEGLEDRPFDLSECYSVDVQIELVGSCCTLVAEKLLNDGGFKIPGEISQLLFECIVLDTVCLSEQAGRTTSKDVRIVNQLEGLLTGVNRQKTFDDIQAAKMDISGLSNDDLLRKDVKVIRADDKFSLAMSSLPVSAEDFLARRNAVQDLRSFTERQEVGGAVIMSLTVTDSGVAHRQLAVYCDDPAIRDKICATLSGSKDPDLELHQLPSAHQHVVIYDQCQVTASRKKVLPLLTDLIHKF